MSNKSTIADKPLTMADVQQASREYALLRSTNKTLLAATVVKRYQSEPRAKMKDNLPVFDGEGNQVYYDPRCEVTVAFIGGEKVISVSLADFNRLQVGHCYMFTGRLGLVRAFGSESVDTVFDSIEEI